MTYKKKQIVVDIETYANTNVLNLMPEPKIASNITKEETKQKAIAAAKDKQIESMGLSPLTGKIACIGYYNDDYSHVSFGSEEDILSEFLKITDGYQIITFNGKSFDIPFVYKRGIIIGKKWATIPMMKKYTDKYKSESTHIDVMAEFCDFGKFESLDNLSSLILGERKKDFDFKEIPTLLESKEGMDKIADYCLQDCKLTWKLAEKMGFISKGE
jgi:DNA polymerase elongation subunit (family B)